MVRNPFKAQSFSLGILIALVQTAAAVAQAQPASQPAAPISPKGTLSGPPGYVDGSFGFSLVYPDESAFEREKHFLTPSELEIVRFVHLLHTWSLAVHLVTEDRPAQPADMLEKTAAKLSKESAGFKSVRSDVVTIGSREGARFACSFKADEQEWLRQQAFIRKSTKEYYTLIFLTPLADQSTAVAAFDRIVDSFKILRSELEQQRVESALKRGAEFRTMIARDPAKLRALGKRDTFLRYIENGKEIGFRRTLQTPREKDRRAGIMIQEWGWLFRDDKSITQLQQAMFISQDLSYAEWDNRTRVFVPADKGKPLSSFGIEMGVLKDSMLLMNYTPIFNASVLKEKAIAVEPSFGPVAWFAVLPQVLDLTKRELYAFSAYDSDRRGLILRTYEVVGPMRVVVDGKRLEAVRIRDSEGLQPPINEIDVDSTGKLLRAKAGLVELVATTPSYIEKTYKVRVDKALEILAKYPVPPPGFPDREPKTPPLEESRPSVTPPVQAQPQ